MLFFKKQAVWTDVDSLEDLRHDDRLSLRSGASLLLVTHVPLRIGPRGLMIDDQTARGIRQWCRYFDRISFYGILERDPQTSDSSTYWVELSQIVPDGRAQLFAMPWAYDGARMLRHMVAGRRELRQAIAAHRHLCFTLGSVIGDWPAVAAFEAIRQQRSYAAWIDRVEPFIIRNKLADAPVKRMVAECMFPFTQGALRYLLRKSQVALLQGGDTYEYYAADAPAPHCTYDTHTDIAEQIGPAALSRKIAHILAQPPLKIVYVGRAAGMKGPMQWLDALELLHQRDVPFRASWIGDGPELAAMRARVAASGLESLVELPGFEGRREILLERMRQSDLLLFCHQTPESARCLIEALVCGCPVVGYGSAYPQDLVSKRGGGLFVERGDCVQLAERLEYLHHDRLALARLVTEAASSGELYNEDAVYAHRAQLMLQA